MPSARFDDLVDGRTISLTDPFDTVVARDPGDVVGALEWASAMASSGAWVAGYVAYDAAPALDPALVAHSASRVPLAWFAAFERDDPVRPAHDDAGGVYSVSRWTPLIDRAGYEDAFDRVKGHIRAGDTYQVNLTFPMRAAFAGDPGPLYADLVAAQEAAYACHLQLDGHHVLSVSPERFFAIDGRRITTRPMKGTRPRGRWRAEDLALRDALAASEKDRAENLMIVDLIRNDLGRIARFGTVQVDELFAIERYRTVWQMTSQVSAELRDGSTLVDVFAALFPCGSVTGAPKARSMEIIREVEPHARGVYCGALGFIPPGDGIAGASFSVAIRTAVIDAVEGVVSYGVGGGVTWDSDRDTEYAEALSKALVLTTPPEVGGLFETIRWDREWVWFDDHMERLADSAEFYGIPLALDEIRERARDLGRTLAGPTRMRVAVDRAGAVEIELAAAPARFAIGPGPDTEAVTVGIDFDPIDARDDRLFHKTTDRSVYDLRARRHRDWEDVVLTNGDGNVTETTVANVAFLFGDRWVTPPVEDGLLPGVMRRRLLADGVLAEQSVAAADAYRADAVAVFNSVRGWRPAHLVAAPVRSAEVQ